MVEQLIHKQTFSETAWLSLPHQPTHLLQFSFSSCFVKLLACSVIWVCDVYFQRELLPFSPSHFSKPSPGCRRSSFVDLFNQSVVESDKFSFPKPLKFMWNQQREQEHKPAERKAGRKWAEGFSQQTCLQVILTRCWSILHLPAVAHWHLLFLLYKTWHPLYQPITVTRSFLEVHFLYFSSYSEEFIL